MRARNGAAIEFGPSGAGEGQARHVQQAAAWVKRAWRLENPARRLPPCIRGGVGFDAAPIALSSLFTSPVGACTVTVSLRPGGVDGAGAPSPPLSAMGVRWVVARERRRDDDEKSVERENSPFPDLDLQAR